MTKLDVLVPHWQEKPEEMTPLLDSLALQQGVDLSDVGVIIAFDGPEATWLPIDEWDSTYPFSVRSVHPPKGGVSATRNAALDASEAELVQFADADDMFSSVTGLFIIFEQYEKTHFQTFVAVFYEQTKDANGHLTFIERTNDSTFVHSKVHNRQWLLDNELRFCDRLTIHEDSYMNILCREVADPDKAIYCPYPFYLWRWRDASVCRHDDKYILKTYSNMIDSNDALIDEFTRRMMPEKSNAYCAFMIFDAYYTMNKQEWIDTNNEEYRDAVEKRFAKYFAKHKSKWESLTPQEKAMISNGVRQRSIGEGMLLEAVTIDQWLDRVQKRYSE